MADRYSVPSPGEAFATSFANTVTPYITASVNKFGEKEENQFNTWRGQWAKLKDDWTTSKTANAATIRQAEAITNQLYTDNNGYTREDFQAHVLSDLLLRGDVDKTLTQVGDQVWNGALRTRSQLNESTRKNIDSLAANKPPVETDAPNAAERETVSLFFAGQENTGGARPDALTGLTEDFTGQLNSFYNALPEDIRTKVTIGSGYRSSELQATLRADKESQLKALHPDWSAAEISKEAGKWVGSAKGSRHTHGNAVDLYYNGQRLDKAPADIIQLVHGASSGTGIHFPLGNEAWHAEAKGTREEGYSGTARNSNPSGSPTARTGTRFSASGLPSFTGDADEVGLGQKMSEGTNWLFGQDDNYYITTAQRRFRSYLEESGELALYQEFQNGTKTFKPISSVSPLTIDQNTMRQDLPSLFDIKDASGWENVNALITSGVINPKAEWQAGFNALGVKINALSQFGLERNLTDIVGNPDKVQDAYDIINTMSEEERKANIPAQYWNTVQSLQAANEARGKEYSENPVVNELTKLQLAADREIQLNKQNGTTDTAAQDAFKAYSQNDLPIIIKNEILNNPDSDPVKKLGYLLDQREQYAPDSDEYAKLTVQIQNAIRNEKVINNATSAASGSEVFYVKTFDTDGTPTGFEKVNAETGMNTTGDKVFTNAITGDVIDPTSILPLTEEMIKDRSAILSTITTDERAYNKAGLALQDSMGLAIQIIDVARDVNLNQVIKAPTTFALASGAKRLGNEISAVLQLTEDIFSTKGPDAVVELNGNPAIERKLNSIDAAIRELEASGVSDQLTEFKLLQARQLLLIYRVGSLEGQSGTAMSNKDFDRLKVSMTSSDPRVVVENLYDYFNGKIAGFDTQLFQLQNNSKIVDWEASSGLGEGSFFGQKSGFIPLKDLYENTFNANQKRGYEFFTGSGTVDAASSPTVVAPEGTSTTPKFTVGENYMGLGNILEVGEGFIVYDFEGSPVKQFLTP
jgi:hypothetical protein